MRFLSNLALLLLSFSAEVCGRAVGPVSSNNGYPVWYRDDIGIELELCLDFVNPLCNFVGNEIPSPSEPISFPDNWPGEAFWWMGEAALDNGAGQTALLVMALEAAFASGEVALPGDQIAFGRVRIRLDGFEPDTNYIVTHPYGERIVTAEADGSVFFTDDIGALTTPADFSLPLDSPVSGSFLRWDPAVEPAAPAGFLGDPVVEHTVTGSPSNNNFFRVCPVDTATPPCLQTDNFIIMGKEATISGVEVLRANFFNTHLDVFAKALPGQTLFVSGDNIYTTEMKGDDGLGSDLYYAKVETHPDTTPLTVTVTNANDGTTSMASVIDVVIITSVEYNVNSSMLSVTATSSVSTATLTADPGGPLPGVASVLTFPPLDVTVTSSEGGSSTKAVELVGPNFERSPIIAFAIATPSLAIPGQMVTLDGTGSVGDITAYSWVQVAGPTEPTIDVLVIDGQPAKATFVVPQDAVPGVLTFELTVSGAEGSVPSTVQVTVTVSSLDIPGAVANAQTTAIVGTTVTLDGSASTSASSYQWSYESGPAGFQTSDIQNAGQSQASFVMPFQLISSAEPLVFLLTVTNTIGESATTTVTVLQEPDTITLSFVELRTRRGQFRVEGEVAIISEQNQVSIYQGDGISGSYDKNQLIGTVTADPAAVPMFSFRVQRNFDLTSVAQTIDLVSSRGAFLDEIEVPTRN